MESYIRFIEGAWKDFTDKGYLNPSVRPEIAESWKRCRNYGVDHSSGKGNKIYKVPVEIKLEENAELMAVARPIMQDVYNTVAGSGFAMILADKDGYVLDTFGDKEIMKKVEELNFVKGMLWTEEAVGTNAIGTALYLDKPIQTIGAEHYGWHQHSWTCSAAPIHDEDGNIIGCINMSGNYYSAHSHTLGIVTSAAQYIQKQLALTLSYKLLNVTFDSVSEGMIVLDEFLNIKRVNGRACTILRISLEEALKINIKETLIDIDLNKILKIPVKTYNNIECDFYINRNAIKCIINAVPMNVNNKNVGVVITFREAEYVHKLVNKVVGYKANYTFKDFITEDYKMKSIIELAKKASTSDCSIIIEGESGTGKEVIAQSIHNYSNRSMGAFVAVNCASIPRELVESELFGYEKGAFTGANKEGHPGKFELAHGGTIFLDEIGELPLDIQTKLLRVLDNHTVTRVGGTSQKQLDVRVIGATNRILKEEIKNKSFREDLFYRLNVINIKTIPLRDRKDDIETLVHNFVDKLNMKNNFVDKTLDKSYIENLKGYHWPGNVRELRNVVERDYYLSSNLIRAPHAIDENVLIKSQCNEEKISITPLQELENESIRNAINRCQGNVVMAAKMLNISRATIYRKIKKYALLNNDIN